MNVLLILVGGAIGAIARYIVSTLLRHRMPLGTFVVNVSGSFVLGLISGFAAGAGGLPDWVRVLAGTGFCGALTTYSTFGLETVLLAEDGAWRQASINVAATVVVGVTASWLGWLLSS